MATSFVAILLVALLALINPALSNPQNPNPTDALDDAVSPDSFLGLEKCPNLLKEQMAERVIGHIHVRRDVKDILRWSAKFVDCVAAKFCVCMNLDFHPLIYGCFAAVGGNCMVKAFKGVNVHCALECFKHINHQQLGHNGMSDICFSKCLKKKLAVRS